MIVLGIESSCDETAVALVENGRQVLASTIASQVERHAVFGGVVPEVAAREHLKAIHPLFVQALAESGKTLADIDLIAVTQGPGLIGALLVGVSFAKGLASALRKPLVPVDHVHAHVHGALLGLPPELSSDELFPCLALVISGGHSNLYYMAGPTQFQLLVASMDDACGECFDKVAKVLGLPYPGGPHIEDLARKGDAAKFKMPKMVAGKARLAFSYSGLKTHVAYHCQKFGKAKAQDLYDLCASFQEEALGQLIRKLEEAQHLCPEPVKNLLVAGGVAANKRFQEMIAERTSLKAFFPQAKYCSDNAAMIAAFGFHEYLSRCKTEDFSQYDWDAYSRYRYEQVIMKSNP